MSTNQWVRLANVGVLIFILNLVAVQSVSGHGSESTTKTGFDILFATGVIAIISAIAGFAAVALRGYIKIPIKKAHNHRLIGALFIIIGLSATSSVVMTQAVLGVIGATFGLLFGIILLTRQSSSSCSKTAIGSIMTHRFIEGSALAALSTTGRMISVFGIVILTIHATIECISLGAYQKITRTRAMASILIITFSFILGFSTGIFGFLSTDTAATELLISAIGSLLLVIGVSELQLQIFNHINPRSASITSKN